jgi:protein ImuB
VHPTACVDVPFLALQTLLRAQPAWRQAPVAVLETDKPQARLLSLNRAARAAGLRVGERYQQALERVPGLHAAPVSPEAIATVQDELLQALLELSPHVEPHPNLKGCFWLDASGLLPLFPSLQHWAGHVHEALHAQGFHAAVVVGLGRFAPWALARQRLRGGVQVLTDPVHQQQACDEVPLACLPLPSVVQEALERLGVVTLADFKALPEAGLLERFCADTLALWRFATRPDSLPLQPARPAEIFQVQQELPYPLENAGAVVFALKPMLDDLLLRLARRNLAVAGLYLRLVCSLGGASVPHGWQSEGETNASREENLQPAEPSLNSVQLMELLRLRLDALHLPGPLVELSLRAEPAPAQAQQLETLAKAPRRDLAAGLRALARLRAAFGDDRVVVARLSERHLPEKNWQWEPAQRLWAAAPPPVKAPAPLVRVLFAQPSPVQNPWAAPAVPPIRQAGPYRLAGGWWQRPLVRDYYFIETQQTGLGWVYHDPVRQRWYLHGRFC